MSAPLPTKAMVLAAGKGTRMRPLTDDRPKALVDVDGKPLIDHALDHVAEAGIAEAVVNVHYLAQQLIDHLNARAGGPATTISDESGELLETGGGLVKALPLLGDAPFFVINGDAIWTNEGENALHRLARHFNPDTMDVLLLLIPREEAVEHPGNGDFFLHLDDHQDSGTLSWRGDAPTAPYVYTGLHVTHPALFEDSPSGAFRLTDLWKRASETGRLYGIVHQGKWHDVGTPAGRDAAEAMLQQQPKA